MQEDRPRQRMKTGQWPWPGDTKVCRSYQVLGSWNWKQSAGLDPITLVAGAAMNQPFGSSSSHGRSIRDRWIKIQTTRRRDWMAVQCAAGPRTPRIRENCKRVLRET